MASKRQKTTPTGTTTADANSTESKDENESFFDKLHDGNGVFKYCIGNEWKTSTSGKTTPIENPETRKITYHIQDCTTAEVDACFAAAKSAQRQWATTPLHQRAAVLHRTATLLRTHSSFIANVLVKSICKNPKAALSEVLRTADLIDYCAEEGVRVKGDVHHPDSFTGNTRSKICLVQRVPLGVILAIPPFNYPINLAASKLAPALITGNAVIMKPPTTGAVAGLCLAQCFALAGLPAGVLNTVTGRGSDIGDYLTTHTAVNCISFTGGTTTGRRICEKAGMVVLQMELGGKDNAIVLEDADLDLAASHIVKGGFSYNGQRCTAVKKVLVMEKIADKLIVKILEKMAKLKVGSAEGENDITAVISSKSADYIQSLVQDAIAKGAEAKPGPFQREENLIHPLLLDGVTSDMSIAWEEPFGPVLPVQRVKSVEEAVELANNSEFGLQGCVFTRDVAKAISIADQIHTGSMQINAAPARGPDHFPFQGFKGSGLGSQGIASSIACMSKAKNTVINLGSTSFPV